MINSLVGSIMNMSADVYIQQATQNKSGNIQREWVYSSSLACKVEPMSSGNALSHSNNESFGTNKDTHSFSDNFQLKMKCMFPLSRRSRVSSIRTSDGEVIYKELDRIGQPDMIFNVTSCYADIDPLGRISHYEVTLERVPVQKNDIS